MATRDEVAKLAGVSGATVSRVFNNQPGVASKTRKLVLEAAQKLNYYPNSNGRRLVSQRSNTLAVLVPYVSDKVHIFYRHYFAEILWYRPGCQRQGIRHAGQILSHRRKSCAQLP